MSSKQSITAPPFISLGKVTAIALLLLLQTLTAFSATWFVATNGLDSNGGASNSPFATIMKAQSVASAGDTVWLRGGTYFLNYANVTATNNPWVIVNNITKSGISYIAFPGELPVFDFSNVLPPLANSNRVTAFLVTASSCTFKGFDVVGVPVNVALQHTQSENFRVAGGSNNRFEQLKMHDGMANGWYLTSGSSNLVLNCDAYNNRGLDSGSLGNTDGFGCHPNSTSGKGNILIGCRAWFNSDDGYDCINAFAAVTFSNCWAFYNGYFTNFSSSTGDGNGFKVGGYGVSGGSFPNPIPRHTAEFLLAVHNRASGIYANHYLGGGNWFNNTSYRNGTDFNMLCSTNNGNSAGDVPGYDHVMKNNLGYKGGTEVSNLGPTNDATFNFFNLPVTVATNDFYSLDESQLTAPRQTNGNLPVIAFAQLAAGSDLVDKGTNIGFAYAGAAPDLGAFENGFFTGLPTMTIAKAGTNLIFSGSSGWPNGTNYLLSSTNLTTPATQWARLKTNRFDMTGSFMITNFISSGTTNQFYRLGIP